MGLFDFKKKKSKISNAECFLNIITQMFGEPNFIHSVDGVDGGAPVSVFFFQDLPEEGTLTSVTYGLSEGEHPDWKNGKCELILSLDTSDNSWGLATAVFANSFRGEKSFTYGSLFTTDEPISNESEVCGFFTFAPSFLDQQQSKIELPDYPVYLTGMYPIYKEEIDVFNEIGLERFWHSNNFNMYDVKRKPIRIE